MLLMPKKENTSLDLLICKRCGKNKESSYLQYWDVNNVFSLAILQRFSVNFLKVLKNFLNLMKILPKTIMKKVMNGIFLKLRFNILKNYITFAMIHHFYLNE